MMIVAQEESIVFLHFGPMAPTFATSMPRHKENCIILRDYVGFLVLRLEKTYLVGLLGSFFLLKKLK